MNAKMVSRIPPRGASKGPHIDWDKAAILAQKTGQPVLVAEHVINTRVKSVRQYTRPPFVQDDGRIIVKLRNSKVEADGIRYGDIYFEWQSTTTEEA